MMIFPQEIIRPVQKKNRGMIDHQGRTDPENRDSENRHVFINRQIIQGADSQKNIQHSLYIVLNAGQCI
jgi:hypothetical protein